MVQPIDEVTSPVDALGQSGGGGGVPGEVSWGDITGTLSNQTDLQSALSNKVNTSTLGAPNGVATLDADGQVKLEQLPVTVITEVFVVDSQADMLALEAQIGDVAIRTDLYKSFILKGSDPSDINDWSELLTPPNEVLSVNNKVGHVKINPDDLDDTETTNKFVTASDLVLLSTAIQPGDPALTDEREWVASTVPQLEAEGGESTTRRAWTAQRVRQAIVAWWNSIGTTVGKALLNLANPGAVRFIRINENNTVTARSAADFRTDLGLGTAATLNVTESGARWNCIPSTGSNGATHIGNTLNFHGGSNSTDTYDFRIGVTGPTNNDLVFLNDEGTLVSTLTHAGSLRASANFVFVNDSDTGITNPTADSVALRTGGTDKLTINSNGNVAIGTAPSTIKLDVRSAVDQETLLALNSSATLTNPVVTAHQTSTTDCILFRGRTLAINRFEVNGLGEITLGQWKASPIGVDHGGTGANNADDARANLGLGTAATATLTTSTRDETIGRVLQVGDQDIGRRHKSIGALTNITPQWYSICTMASYSSKTTIKIYGGRLSSAGRGEYTVITIGGQSNSDETKAVAYRLTNGDPPFVAYRIVGDTLYGLGNSNASFAYIEAFSTSNLVTPTLTPTTDPGGTDCKVVSTFNTDSVIPIENGGTNANNAADARANLGAASTDVATPSANGLMSMADKAKLDNIPSHVPYVKLSINSSGMVTVVGASAGITASVVSQTNESDLVMSFSFTSGHGLTQPISSANMYVDPENNGKYYMLPTSPANTYIEPVWTDGNFTMTNSYVEMSYFPLPVMSSDYSGYIFFK